MDPVTFRVWLRALQRARDMDPRAVLWLLSSGDDCERHWQAMATQHGLPPEALVFCNVIDRPQHLQRLAIGADLFLDTPCYNAHTVGCDALFANVLMVSLLLSPTQDEICDAAYGLSTDKWASRVGASLLKAAGLPELICPTLAAYEDCMVRCVQDPNWYATLRQRLRDATNANNNNSGTLSALFNTQRWVDNFEIGLEEMVKTYQRGDAVRDILIKNDGDCNIDVTDHK